MDRYSFILLQQVTVRDSGCQGLLGDQPTLVDQMGSFSIVI